MVKQYHFYVMFISFMHLASAHDLFEEPICSYCLKPIYYTGFSLSYSEKHEQPYWVAYELTITESMGTIKRTDNFREDENINTGSAKLEDYKYSGYDRGHLAPAADMKWSKKAMSESFLFSNITPQNQKFNREIWHELEKQIRKWVKRDSSLYIITGPILKDGLKTIGQNKVSIPEHFFKVILGQNKAIGFIIPNKPLGRDFSKYAVTIDSVETIIGMDFFSTLPDDIENSLESMFDISLWVTKPKNKITKSPNSKCSKDCPKENRTGAICNDGTLSDMTGRGTCSGHGGVKCWKCK